MIWDSSYWKRDLTAMASRLRKLNALEDWTEEQYARVEKDVMLGAFICRKLGESHMFTDAHWGQQLNVTTYPLKREPPTFMNNHRPEDFYDLETPMSETVAFEVLCNQVIHSHVFGFMVEGQDAPQHYIWVASDRGRRQRLIQVSLVCLADVFHAGGKNYPHTTEAKRVPGKDDFEVRSW